MSNWPLGHEFNQIQNCKEATDQNCSCFTCQVFIYEILFVFYFPQDKKNKTFGHINGRHDHEPNIVILSCVSRSTAGANQRTKTVNKFSSRTLFYGSQQYFDSTCGNVNIVCKGKTKFYSFFMSHFLGYVYTMNDVFVIMPTSNEKLYRIILIQTAITGR